MDNNNNRPTTADPSIYNQVKYASDAYNSSTRYHLRSNLVPNSKNETVETRTDFITISGSSISSMSQNFMIKSMRPPSIQPRLQSNSRPQSNQNQKIQK
jgi:hypothetical protein